MSKRLWWMTGSGRVEIGLHLADARSASHPGPCDDDVSALSARPYVKAQLAKLDPKALADELREYGAWDDEELADHEQNLQRVLWLACGDVAERPDDYR